MKGSDIKRELDIGNGIKYSLETDIFQDITIHKKCMECIYFLKLTGENLKNPHQYICRAELRDAVHFTVIENGLGGITQQSFDNSAVATFKGLKILITKKQNHNRDVCIVFKLLYHESFDGSLRDLGFSISSNAIQVYNHYELSKELKTGSIINSKNSAIVCDVIPNEVRPGDKFCILIENNKSDLDVKIGNRILNSTMHSQDVVYCDIPSRFQAGEYDVFIKKRKKRGRRPLQSTFDWINITKINIE